MVALYRSVRAGDTAAARRYQGLLDELVEKLAALPVPWGIRAGLAVRGYRHGPFPLPLSEERLKQILRFQEWLPTWLAQAQIPNLMAVQS